MKREHVLSKLAARELNVEVAVKLLEKVERQSRRTLEWRVTKKGGASKSVANSRTTVSKSALNSRV